MAGLTARLPLDSLLDFAGIHTLEPYSFHYCITRPDGREQIIHARGSMAGDEYGNPVRMFGTAQDVMERRLAEAQLKSSNEKLRALSASLQSAREEEGTRIARELHDELGSALAGLKWELESINRVGSEAGRQRDFLTLRKKIAGMIELIDSTINTVRRISSELRPGILDDLGVVAALEWQAQQFATRTGIICQFDSFIDNTDLDWEQSTAIFRIFQAALTNILRHAQATTITVMLEEEEGEFVLEVKDNGKGITEEESSGAQSLGLIGMRERAHLMGGRLEIAGVVGKGTVLTVRVPRKEP